MNDFGEFLKAARVSRKMSIRQVALYAGCSDSYLSFLERGIRGSRGPSPVFLRKLVSPLGVPYEVLMSQAGYQIQTSDDIVLHGFILQMLREVLGDTVEEFTERLGMSRIEIETLEQKGVSIDTLREVFEKLFGHQRMLTPGQKLLIDRLVDFFPRIPLDYFGKVEGALLSTVELVEHNYSLGKGEE